MANLTTGELNPADGRPIRLSPIAALRIHLEQSEATPIRVEIVEPVSIRLRT